MSEEQTEFFTRIIRLVAGLIINSVGIVLTLNANIGYSPWDVLHAGLAKLLGVSFGVATIIVGLSIGALLIYLGEKLGLGTVLGVVLVGAAIEVIMGLDILPKVLPEVLPKVLPGANKMALGLAMLTAGLFINAAGIYLYLDAGFGVGPRDGLMVALERKTGAPSGLCRVVIELAALLAGWLMGGMAGVGTVVAAFAFGLCIQITFGLFKFNPTKVEHETLDKTYITLVSIVKGK